MDAHDISETARKLVLINKPPSFGPTTMMSSSPPPTNMTTNINTTDTPMRTVTFDENSPEQVKNRGRPQEQEEKKQEEDDDDDNDSVKPSILRTPHHNAIMRNFGSAQDEEEAPHDGTMIDFGSSPDSADATPSPNRPSPFRSSPFRPNASESNAVNASLPRESRKDDDGASPMSKTSDPHGFSYASARTIGLLDSFAHDSSDDGNGEEWSVNSPLTTYQRNAENLTYRETKRWSRRVNELEEQLGRSQAMVQELRDDKVEQQEQAKRQAQKLFLTFQAKLKSFAESFHARADALEGKHDWTMAALDRLVHDVEFCDRPDSVASDLSETLHSEIENDLYAAGIETHMEFLKSPNAVAAVPAAALPSAALEDWMVEKTKLEQELEMTKSELELAKAGSESLRSMLAAKDDSEERDELRRTNAKLLQKIAEVEEIVAKRTQECKHLNSSLVQTQSASCRPTEPHSARPSGGLLKRLSAKHKRKAPSPVKSPLFLTPNKLLKETIATLRSRAAASESKQADLAASLDKVRKQCQIHETTASQLASELVKVKNEFKNESLKSAEHRLSLKAQISLLECKVKDQESELDLAHSSCKMALKEKGQLRNEVSELEQRLRSVKQMAATLEQVYKKSEDRKSKQLRELQELDKQSTVYITDLKGTIKQLEEDIVQLERQKNVHGAQITAYEKTIRELRNGSGPSHSTMLNLRLADKEIRQQRTFGMLEEKLSRTVDLESQLTCTKHLLSETCKDRDALVRQLDNIADRLLRVHHDENDENKRPVGIAALLDRVEDLLAAERDLSVTKAQLEKSSADAMRYWTKCLRWESTYDRAMDEVHRVRTQLRHYQTIDNQRNIQNTILKQRTDIAKRETAALAANCCKQQRELDNVAAALFDAKPSPASATHC